MLYRSVKGSPLTSAEVDANFLELRMGLDDILGGEVEPVGIADISVVAGSLTVTLTDTTELGPFPIPVSAFNWRGEWANGTSYSINDFFTVAGLGVFLTLEPHFAPGSGPFDPAAVDSEFEPLYRQVFGTTAPQSYHLALNFTGLVPGDQSVVYAHIPAQALSLSEDLPGSVFRLLTATTAAISFALKKNGGAFGSIDFAAADTVGTIVSTIETLVSGDLLTITAPDVADATAANLVGTIIASA
jgi:hypothetical protein